MRIDPHGTTSFNFGPPQWQYVRDMPALSNRADSWHGIAKFDSPSISLFGKQVRPSYGTLKAGDGTVLNLPDRQLGRWPFYITTIAIDGGWIAVTANSSPMVLLIDQSKGALRTTDTGEWDCWAGAAEIRCPSRKYSVEYLVQRSRALDPKPAPDRPLQYVKQVVGSAVPLVEYWRAWVALHHSEMP